MASALSFQGLSTNLPTDKLVQAIMDQESQPLVRMQTKQAQNTKRMSALRQVNSGMLAFNTSLASLSNSSFLARSVATSDSTNTYVTATGSGAATGAYDVKVGQLATKAQMSSMNGLATADSTAVGKGTYALKAMDGTTKTFTIDDSNNTLNGMRDAINASGGGVLATIVNTGSGATPYKLIVTAKDTGTGTNGSTAFTLAQTSGTNSLGVALGTLTGSDLTAGGTAANTAAQDAQFTVNGIDMTRKNNVVTDAVDGMTFTLKSGGQSTATTFTVSSDKTAITNAMNDMITKFNAVLKTITDNTGADKPFGYDRTVRSLLETQRASLTGAPTGLPSGHLFTSGAEMGIKTNRDGTLSLDTAAFQAAIDKSPAAAQSLFANISTSVQTSVLKITSPGSGDIAAIISGVDRQNAYLTQQISSMQSRLDRRKDSLQNQFAQLETTIGRMNAAGQSLNGLAR